jgi:hypothetical protein
MAMSTPAAAKGLYLSGSREKSAFSRFIEDYLNVEEKYLQNHRFRVLCFP